MFLFSLPSFITVTVLFIVYLFCFSLAINKYRRYGFSVEATMELMKKDIAFHTIFSDWPISVMVARFEALVAERRILPLVTNSDVVQWADLKGGESEGSGEGEGESAALGRLAVQFLDLACMF
jgi:hypothetical protein